MNPILKHRKISVLRVIAILAGLALVALAIAICWLIFRDQNAAFHSAIANADRISVFDGGNGGDGPLGNDVILFEVTDPRELKTVFENIKLKTRESPCKCFGFPGIEWFRGKTLLATTSVQHGGSLRWQGDFILDEQSAEWLVEWLVQHGVSEKEIEGGCGGPRLKNRHR